MLRDIPEWREPFQTEWDDWNGEYGPYLAMNDLARWCFALRDEALIRRVFSTVDSIYADRGIADGNELAIEFFESVCEAGRDQYDRFIGDASRSWFDDHGW